jgi:hypothetical protein
MGRDEEVYKRELGRLLSYYEVLINKALNTAIENFNKGQATEMYLFNKSDMAGVMHAYIRGAIRETFDPIPGCYVVEKTCKAFMLFLDGKPLGIDAFAGIKFKKQSPNLRTANIQTKSVIQFNSQQKQYLLFLPDIQATLMPEIRPDQLTNPPKAANVIAGYQPNITWTGFDRLALTFPLSRTNIELLSDITDVSDHRVDNVTEFPTAPPRKSQVRARQDKKEEKPKKVKNNDGKDG